MLGRVFLSMARNAETIPELQRMTASGMVNDSVGIVAAVLALMVVAGIDRLQREAVARQPRPPCEPPEQPDGFVL
ncbi:MAG: hypothetical protein FJX72_10070 [Armatimonadetes bacterium]|nr:hypothetical protein [Armatimonadota bacterium]